MNFLSQLENEKKGHIFIKVSGFPKIENNNQCLELINYCALEFSKALLRSQEAGSETFDCTINLEGIKMKNLHLDFANGLSKVMKQLFPERLGKCYLVNAPNFFEAFYKIIRSFLDAPTRRKFMFVKDNECYSCEEK